MRVVLDTNVLLVIVSQRSQFHYVYRQLIAEQYHIAFSTPLLLEYEEQLSIRYDISIVREVLGTLLNMPNGRRITPSYHWHLIPQDPDDNMVVDCAIATNADFIVTNDRHFDVLAQVPFPVVKCITLQKFQQMLAMGGQASD